MFEKEAEELFNKKPLGYEMKPELEIYKDGFNDGYNKALEEWKKCFLSCSSPFCSKQFPTVELSGVLGNMEKTEIKTYV